MTSAVVQQRERKAEEYLELLRRLASEIECAMQAITRNALPEFEESVATQEILSARLVALADELSVPLKSNAPTFPANLDEDLMRKIAKADEALQKVNRGYAALLQHSSRSVALMMSLLGSFQGQIKEASGPRLKVQTWSCQM